MDISEQATSVRRNPADYLEIQREPMQISSSRPPVAFVTISECPDQERVEDSVTTLAYHLNGLKRITYSGPRYIRFVETRQQDVANAMQLVWESGKSPWDQPRISFLPGKKLAEALNETIGELLRTGVGLIFHSPPTIFPTGSVDFESAVDLLENDPLTGCVRFWPPTALAEGRMELIRGNWYVHLARSTPPKSFGWGAALYHRRFWEAYGRLPEADTPESIELLYNQVMSTINGPRTLFALQRGWEVRDASKTIPT